MQRTQLLILGLVIFTGLGVGCAHIPSSGFAATVAPVAAIAPDIDLQTLINQAPSHSTVLFPAGQFVLHRALVVENKQGLKIVAKQGFILLVSDVNSEVMTIKNCSDLSIEGGSFAHQKPLGSYECDAAVLGIENSRTVTVRHSTLHGCGAIGVDGRTVKGLTIEGCLVHHNTFNAIYLYDCSEVKILDNIIEHNGNTFQMHLVDDLEMSGNLIQDNGGYWRTPATRPGPDE